jgi:hypothetical protein
LNLLLVKSDKTIKTFENANVKKKPLKVAFFYSLAIVIFLISRHLCPWASEE